MNRYAILHIDLGRTFRGGQRQTFNLNRYLKLNGIETGCVVAAGGKLEDHLTKIGVATFPINYNGFDIVSESVRLKRICGELGFNIIHAHDSHGHNLALTMKFLKPDLRVVVTRRVISGKSKTLMSQWKYTTSKIDFFIAVSSAIENELLQWGVSDRRVVQIPSGVDLAEFSQTATDDFREKYHIPEKKFYIGTACALDKNKDVATLIRAAGKLSCERDDYLLLVAGDGAGRMELEALMRLLDVEGNVKLLGEIDDMSRFYSLLDIYVLSSRSEGLGTSLIEAGACGCTLVASDCGGPRDFIDDNRSGFLFPVEDDEKLFLIIKELLDDDSKRESAAKVFSEKLDLYEIDHVCEQVVKYYNRLALLTG